MRVLHQNQILNPGGQIFEIAVKHIRRRRFAGLEADKKVVNRRNALPGGFAVHAQQRFHRGVQFPAIAPPARAEPPVRRNHHVAEFARPLIASAIEMTVQHDAAADAVCQNAEKHKILHGFGDA